MLREIQWTNVFGKEEMMIGMVESTKNDDENSTNEMSMNIGKVVD